MKQKFLDLFFFSIYRGRISHHPFNKKQLCTIIIFNASPSLSFNRWSNSQIFQTSLTNEEDTINQHTKAY